MLVTEVYDPTEILGRGIGPPKFGYIVVSKYFYEKRQCRY